jgi:hypothetical protein
MDAIELAERLLVAALTAGDQIGRRGRVRDGLKLSGHLHRWSIVPHKTFMVLVTVWSWTISTAW